MRRVIEYTLISPDGVFDDPVRLGFMAYRDPAYLRDGLGLLMACEAMLMGRVIYEANARIWPARAHPWADRLNSMKKYVFSSSLGSADWNNSTIIRDDAAATVAKLKEQGGGDLLIWGHGRFAESLLQHKLIDALDLSIHPLLVGHGKTVFWGGPRTRLNLVATKSFSNIVKLSYDVLYSREAGEPRESAP
ncbi:MAG TPA: dihydrofolate reductase family protein [Steroidobacteraceae bacterium]|nr:dihydrofolate reductase family protein [Steroidobacteraceae bacterium]